ncbi:MAG: methyltransferase domain-containing protein, partial [Actinomycetota bacterium]|nr:methyltransferase domain-containing protein [Actinomycetota bacterium]
MSGDTYTHGHHASVLRSHAWRTAENSCGYLLPRLRATDSLLDVGCGVGTITLDLAERLSNGWVHAIEPSDNILDGVRTAATERGLDNVTIEVGDVYRLAYDDASFDVTHAHQVLQHLSDPVAALREMQRVTKPGGLVAVRDADYAGMFWAPADPRLDHWMATYRKVAKHNQAEPDAGRFLLRWALDAGFTEIEPSASTWVFATDADREYWGGSWQERAVKSAFAEQAVAYGYATAGDLQEWVAGFQAWQSAPDGWFA